MKPLVFLLSLLVSSTVYSVVRVSVDPGHGGEDQGAVHENIKEADIALAVSKELHQLLSADPQFQSQLLRTSDQTLSLEQRVRQSKNFKAEIYLSIHANAHSDTRAKGSEFYIQNQLPMEEEALLFAHNEITKTDDRTKSSGDIESIIEDLKKTNRILKSYQLSTYMRKNWSHTKSKMIRQGPFYVLSQSEIPAVLIEVGYLSNSKERAQLTQKRIQKQLAKKIHNALKDYAKNMDKLPSSVLNTQNAKTR